MIHKLFAVFFVLLSSFVQGQEYGLTNTFTMADGLPSNHIYAMTEDLDGYLWIATDNGVSRFDGKQFVNYSIEDGLPSADAITIHTTKSGIVWVNCFRQSPSYFDAEQNKFICLDDNPIVNSLSKELIVCQMLENGNILFQSSLGYVELNKSKVVEYNKFSNFTLVINGSDQLTFEIDWKNRVEGRKMEFLFKNKNNKTIDSYTTDSDKLMSWLSYEKGLLTLTSFKTLECLYDFKLEPFSYKKSKIVFPENIDNYKVKGETINVISRKNTLYICDKKSLKLLHEIKLEEKSNSAYRDRDKRIWVATVYKGLQFYSTSVIQKLAPVFLNENTLTLTKTTKEGYYLGGYNGKVTQWNNGKRRTFDLSEGKFDQHVIKIIHVNKETFVFTNNGYHYNFGKSQQLKYALGFWPIKSVELLNNETILVGAQGAIVSFDIPSRTYKRLNVPSERFGGIVRLDDDNFYYIGNDGVMMFTISSGTYRQVVPNQKLNKTKAETICLDEAKNLWIGTSKRSVYFLKNKKGNRSKLKEIKVNDNISRLFARENRLWIATKSGVFVLDYPSDAAWEMNKISDFDGLSSATIFDFFYANDTLNLATAKGVSLVPFGMKFNKFEITPSVISISVNGEIIGNKLRYELKQDQKSVLVHLAGIDLTGHFNTFRYAINDKSNWFDLKGNYLNISLKNGTNKVFIRAVDVNGKISTKELLLIFNVETPFYYQMWFLVLICIIATFLIIGYFARRKIKKQKVLFDQQLELENQRNKITADLHDDIGATLSSLQINSSVASRLMDKNPAEAHKVLDKIENQSHDLGDKIGDIIWSMKPGKDEFMTLGSRIKNFANDILGASEIDYKIVVDTRVDKEIVDMTLRKNLVLIAKEAINNAAKYSQATSVSVEVELVDNFVELEIIDNGIGFLVGESMGNGLTNMRSRVEELNGVFSIHSKLNSQTKIKARIPCP